MSKELALAGDCGSRHQTSGRREGGVCRLGDALSELLALYPPAIEMDDIDLVAQWPAAGAGLVDCEADAYSASRA
ncbi:MAG: hypothetical protein ACREHD_20880 [Pirellulales bacterium]